MAIIKINPFWPQSFIRPWMSDDELWPELTMTEGINIYEEDGTVYIEAPVPGIAEDKVDVTYEDGVLHISAHSETKTEEKKKNRVVHKMQRATTFDYTTYLPRPINEKKIEATLKDGVLVISAPVAEAVKPKKITVKK